MPVKPLFYAAFTVVMVILVAACSKQDEHAFYNSGLVYCSESNPVTFNPQLDTSSTTTDASSHQLYDRLLDFDPDSGRIIPSVASSWLVSDDGLTYTFQLRKDVEFHTTSYFTPSRNFNADDVIFSIDRWRLTSHPYHYVSGGRYPYFESLGLAQNIASVERLNGYRVEINLKRRDSSFLANLATDFSVMLSQEYGEALLEQGLPNRIDQYPIGTGPFKFENYRKDHYIRYQRHQTYWGEQDNAERLIYDITPKSSLRLAKLMTGECDATAFPAQTELEIIRSRDDLLLAEKPGLNVGFWAFNTQRPPFDNPDVRRALAAAIDKNTLLEAVYFDSATRAKTLLPAASWAFQNDADDTAYNPVLARKLLENAGVEPGFTMTIWAMPIERAYNPNAAKMAELIQRYLREVGVTATIVSYDWATFRRHLQEGLHDSVLIGWSADNGDPDNFYRPLLSCGAIPSGTNRAMWCDSDYDELLDKALQTEDLEARRLIYQQVNRLLYERLPLVPIAHAYRYQAYRNELEGMTINPFGGVRFGGVGKSL
ncbi:MULTISPECIES: ABC transporter substrate-binding protein [Alteromonas]|jgi:cationic peptide transport system substrate-binding protein|uniref:ABC transporter substrate-binding protein n=1 Tax=Alteromonas stellipolaris TaxID=233316 RepID=A0AAW7Z362_9ALTE|nr:MULTISPECIES: ABC transporter substrate-binding protein [Alteromonas]AMJ90686.1 peptide ABC transporter substrate-binding protein [Alteromonas sp. Mac2]ALM91417.1 Dipeptide-binding ABC transporter, periplasmic substrate-binding component [Alteromonas stellipolaris LMG 21856]AMJ74394.1 peptide ABC transporter substrate-binding protein [Alteromonas stellipolaris]AMJ86826.1 peptide ABC transporter substrate-binding protein [Alteromonas sp. Mac1]AMJ94569.1 peptide ABC transporter substrate-bind